ncbi:MAG: alkaline phosphatase family protein, partial [Alistipes sp.]|nr:alkaline phosphatase family protein [Alistipes sp.]
TLMPDYCEDDDDKGIFIGSPYNYDCHVPLIFYGGNIASTAVSRKISTTAIAPTIAAILGVEKPDCSEGEVLSEVIY